MKLRQTREGYARFRADFSGRQISLQNGAAVSLSAARFPSMPRLVFEDVRQNAFLVFFVRTDTLTSVKGFLWQLVCGTCCSHHAVCGDGRAGREHDEVSGDELRRVDVAPLAIALDLFGDVGRRTTSHESTRERHQLLCIKVQV